VINLCSAYSYCLTILDTVYVWYGKGSTTPERIEALEYAKNLAGEGSVVELREGIDDDDEMFWMILGNDDYANADHWRWRSSLSGTEPKLWRYTEGSTQQPVCTMSV
jgi:hypothetical protein